MRRETAIILGLLVVAGVAVAAPGGGRHVKASLVAETDAVVPGQPLVVGLRLQMEPGWHTYWSNPGDSGLPTKVKWELPEGFSAGGIQWPRPGRFNTGPLVSYGYHDEVLLPMEIRVPAGLSASEVQLKARVSWLECQEVCLPGKAELTLALPVRPAASPGAAAPLFEKTRRQLPEKTPGWTVSASADAGSIALDVRPPDGTTLDEVYFYSLTRRVLDYAKPQTLQASGKGYRVDLPRDNRGQAVDRLEGVLVGKTSRGPVALEVDVKVAVDGAASGPDLAQPLSRIAASLSQGGSESAQVIR